MIEKENKEEGLPPVKELPPEVAENRFNQVTKGVYSMEAPDGSIHLRLGINNLTLCGKGDSSWKYSMATGNAYTHHPKACSVCLNEVVKILTEMPNWYESVKPEKK